MLILLSGLPGTGKSSLARAVCGEGRAVHLRIDTIEAALMRSVLRPASVEDMGYLVAAAQAAELIGGGHVVVGDAVNATSEGRAAWDVVPGPRLTVEVVCSDEVRHRKRIEDRWAVDPRRSNWAAVEARRWVPWDRPVLRLDTAEETPEALAERLWGST